MRPNPLHGQRPVLYGKDITPPLKSMKQPALSLVITAAEGDNRFGSKNSWPLLAEFHRKWHTFGPPG
jgi:hypothetical protein